MNVLRFFFSIYNIFRIGPVQNGIKYLHIRFRITVDIKSNTQINPENHIFRTKDFLFNVLRCSRKNVKSILNFFNSDFFFDFQNFSQSNNQRKRKLKMRDVACVIQRRRQALTSNPVTLDFRNEITALSRNTFCNVPT